MCQSICGAAGHYSMEFLRRMQQQFTGGSSQVSTEKNVLEAESASCDVRMEDCGVQSLDPLSSFPSDGADLEESQTVSRCRV